MQLSCPQLAAESEANIRRNLFNRDRIIALKRDTIGEGPRMQKIQVILLHGADEINVRRAVEKLRKEKPKVEIEVCHEPQGELEISNNTTAVVFVANGSNKGVDRLFEQTGSLFFEKQIATVLVSEHKDETDRFDHKMTFERAITNGMLDKALQAALYYKRGEFLN